MKTEITPLLDSGQLNFHKSLICRISYIFTGLDRGINYPSYWGLFYPVYTRGPGSHVSDWWNSRLWHGQVSGKAGQIRERVMTEPTSWDEDKELAAFLPPEAGAEASHLRFLTKLLQTLDHPTYRAMSPGNNSSICNCSGGVMDSNRRRSKPPGSR